MAGKKKIMIERWTFVAIGAWLIIAPWVLGFSDSVLIKWSSILCGIILVAMNAWILFEKHEAAKKEIIK
jgi:hypothetical protein